MNNLTKFVSILLALINMGLFATSLYGQGNNNTISLAPNFWKQSGGINPLPSGPNQGFGQDYDGSPAEFTHASIQDENGDLLFFVVDGVVYDKEGYLIDVMESGFITNGLPTLATGNSEVLIVPNPFDCYQYYLFSASMYPSGNNFEPLYGILDLSLSNINYPNRNGAMIPLSSTESMQSLAAITPNYEQITGVTPINRGVLNMYYATTYDCCKENNLVFLSSTRGIIIYEITPNGIIYHSFLDYGFNDVFGRAGTSGQRGEMEAIVIDNEKIRVAAPFEYENFSVSETGVAIYFADLNLDGSLIPGTENHILLPKATAESIDPYINGIEFSPSGEILYVTHNTTSDPNYQWGIRYFDFNNQNQGLQNLIVPLGSSFVKSQIETNNEGKMIFVRPDRLVALNQPNTPDPNNWDLQFLPFQNNFTYQSTGTSPSWNTSNDGGEESFLISKQIKQRSYIDYFFEMGCADVFSDLNTYTGTWSPGLNNNPFQSVNGIVYLDFTLVIPAGADLTIEDMVFKFTPGNKLIVSRGSGFFKGANLTLNNTVLTINDKCDKNAMWAGVEVHGLPNSNQFPATSTPQGKISILNNSKIEHAYRGVSATRILNSTTYPFRPAGVDNTYTGGVIVGINSTFFNNQRDVEIGPYAAPNSQNNGSLFRTCEFVTNGLLNDENVTPNSHVFLSGVDGVRFRGNDMRNETPALYTWNTQGGGILSFNTRFLVDPNCAGVGLPCNSSNISFTPSSFHDLTYGVGVLNFNGNQTFRVDQSEFINNYFGILAFNSNFPRITRNNFEVLPSAAPNETFDTYGVFMSNCTGYTIEENFLTHFEDPLVNGPGNAYGIIIHNSGTASNEVYNNDFTELFVGLQAQRINGLFTGNDDEEIRRGLQFKCNNFFGNTYEADLAVTSGRIRRGQGTCFSTQFNPDESPAGNKFSSSQFTTYNDFGVSFNPTVDQEIDYAHHFNAPPFITEPELFTTQQINLNPCFDGLGNPLLYDANKSCPSRINDDNIIIGGGGVKVPFALKKLDSMQQIADDLLDNIDNGDTDALLNLIDNASNGDIKNGLLDASPYLSNEVILSYIASNPPNGNLKEVLLANSPLSDEVLDALEDVNLPKGVTKQVENAQTGTSDRDQLYEQLSFISNERDHFLNRSIGLILTDSTIVNPNDTVSKLLQNEKTRERREQFCDALICADKEQELETELSEFDSDYGGNNFTGVASIDNKVRQGEIDLSDSTNTSLIGLLESYATDSLDQTAAVRSEAMLEVMDRFFRFPIVEKLVFEAGGKSMIFNQDQEVLSDKSYLKVYPNPTNGTTITLELVESIENGTLVVYNAMGQIVTTKTYGEHTTVTMETSSLNTGVYFIEVQSNQQEVDRVKLIVN